MARTSESSIVHASDLGELRSREAAAGRSVVLTNGCFDLIHPGHLHVLRAAAQLGDTLVVGVNSDASVRRLKGPERPVMSLHDRAAVVGALRWVDVVTPFDDDTAAGLIERLRPQHYVKGADYDPAAGGRRLPEADALRRLGIAAAFVPLAPGHASTDLIARRRGAT